MKMNFNILVFGLIITLGQVVVESKIISTQETTRTSSDKVVVSTVTRLSDGTITTVVVEKTPEGVLLSSKIESIIDTNLKELSYIHDMDVNDADQAKMVPIVEALFSEDLDNVTKIIQKYGINYQENSVKMSLLILAASGSSEQVFVHILKSSGIDVNKEMKNKLTALHVASLFNRKNVLKLLLADGRVDLKIKTSKGHTAEDLARLAGNKEIEVLLKDAAIEKAKVAVDKQAKK